MITGVAFPNAGGPQPDNPYQAQSLYMQIQTLSRLDNYNTAKQVVNAALSNSALTQNAFLTSAQMDSMQTAYKRGTKVFVVEDGSRCYTVPVQPLTTQETSVLAQTFHGATEIMSTPEQPLEVQELRLFNKCISKRVIFQNKIRYYFLGINIGTRRIIRE